MPSEIAYPFAIGPDGSVATVSDPDAQVSQRVHALIGTEPGERWMLNDYGVQSRSLLFEPDDVFLTESLASNVGSAMARYEPGVLVRSVQPVSNAEGSGIVQVAVDYIRREAATTPFGLSRNTNTAVINVGGTVDEVIRG